MENKRLIKVSSTSPVPQTAGSIVISAREGKDIELRAMGAGAVNQMYKAIASARGTLAPKGYNLYIIPGFADIEEEGTTKTVVTAKIVFM